jgi:hypothetical protein
MSEKRDPKSVATHLATSASGSPPPRQELIFDPRTGQLVVADRPSADQVAIETINQDGFFG